MSKIVGIKSTNTRKKPDYDENMQLNNAKDDAVGGEEVRLRPRASSRQASSQPIAPTVAGGTEEKHVSGMESPASGKSARCCTASRIFMFQREASSRESSRAIVRRIAARYPFACDDQETVICNLHWTAFRQGKSVACPRCVPGTRWLPKSRSPPTPSRPIADVSSTSSPRERAQTISFVK